MRRRVVAGVAAAVLVARIVGGGASAEAASPIRGSGSTFAQVALEQWAADIFGEFGLNIDYAGNGSLGGLQNFQDGIVDFASSDVPYPPEQPTGRSFAYVPIVAGGTALMYNLKDPAGNRIESLRLSPQTLANIFFGKIRSWRHPAVLAENPDLVDRLPEQEVRLAVRGPGSGTTGVFTDFLSTTAGAEWQDFVARSSAITQAGGNYITTWPESTANFNCWCSVFAGSAEIANYVSQNSAGSDGSIGYAEAAYAIQVGLPVVRIRNAAGFYRLPDARSVAVALLEATENADGTQNLERVHTSTRDEAYPASSYNYLVLPTGADFDPEKGETLSEYLVYSVTRGQEKADVIGYSPLPPNLVEFALNRVALITGHIEAPPLGEWGRAYERLAPDVPEVVNETPDLGPALDPNTPDPDAAADPNADPNAPADPNNPAGGASNQAGGAAAPGGATPGVTTTTVAGAAAPGAGGPTTTVAAGGRRTTATSIAADGSIVYLEEDSVSGATRVALARGLKFDDEGNLISQDGEPVPEVKAIGVGQLLAIAGVLAALVLLPPLVIGGIIRRRQDADVATT